MTNGETPSKISWKGIGYCGAAVGLILLGAGGSYVLRGCYGREPSPRATERYSIPFDQALSVRSASEDVLTDPITDKPDEAIANITACTEPPEETCHFISVRGWSPADVDGLGNNLISRNKPKIVIKGGKTAPTYIDDGRPDFPVKAIKTRRGNLITAHGDHVKLFERRSIYPRE